MQSAKLLNVEELYWSNGLSCREVAGRIGIGESSVRRWMKKLNIPFRDRSEAAINSLNAKKGKILVFRWTSNLAYTIGLLTSDGNLSSDGRHLEFCSKDKELITTFIQCLRLKNLVSFKRRGTIPRKKYYRVQFGNVNFYKFLLSIGLTPCKSSTLGRLSIPSSFFPDFLRGVFDGDGNVNIVSHPGSQRLQLRTRISSGSETFLCWLKECIYKNLHIKGIIFDGIRCKTLTYHKRASLSLLNYIYYAKNLPCLMRKYKLVKPYLVRV